MLARPDPPPICIGPEDPLRVLPPALLSRSIAAAENVIANLAAVDDVTRAAAGCATLANLFDLNSDWPYQQSHGPVRVVKTLRHGCEGLAVAIGEKYILELGQDRWERPLRQWSLVLRPEYSGRVLGVHCATSSKWWGHVLAESSTVLANSPYTVDPFHGIEHKWRTRIVKMLSSAESTETVDCLAVEVRRHPRLLIMRGWCGGIAFHPVSRLNNTRQLDVLLSAISDRHLQQEIGFSPSDLLDWPNFDGCTPLYIASFFGAEGAVKLLIEAGATPGVPDRFGRYPLISNPSGSERRDAVQRGAGNL